MADVIAEQRELLSRLRDGHVREAAARRARGLGVLRAGSAGATTKPSPSALPITGCGTGTRETTPGYALGCWLRDYKEQVFPFTRDFAMDWTNNVSERGAKAAKRHQAVSGYRPFPPSADTRERHISEPREWTRRNGWYARLP